MANFIRVPLKDTTPAGGSPRYALVKVDDVYDCAISGSGEHIRLYTTELAESTQVQVPIIEYFAGGSGSAEIVVTAQDIENLNLPAHKKVAFITDHALCRRHPGTYPETPR